MPCFSCFSDFDIQILMDILYSLNAFIDMILSFKTVSGKVQLIKKKQCALEGLLAYTSRAVKECVMV